MNPDLTVIAANALYRARTAMLAPPSPDTLDKIDVVHQACLQIADVEIVTDHVLHGGMYARTIKLDPGVVMTGATIRRSTVLVIQGPVSMTAGDTRIDLDGYNVLAGGIDRKSLFVSRGEVYMTMLVATGAKTVEEAENEVFEDDAPGLMSRKDASKDTFWVTGE